jgi:hypothetical protein
VVVMWCGKGSISMGVGKIILRGSYIHGGDFEQFKVAVLSKGRGNGQGNGEGGLKRIWRTVVSAIAQGYS